MFSNNDFYNLDDASKTLKNNKLILDMYIKLETLTQLLIKHDITNELEIEACENYLKSLPRFKTMIDEMTKVEQKINSYKGNPQQHLKDLMSAKLTGQIR